MTSKKGLDRMRVAFATDLGKMLAKSDLVYEASRAAFVDGLAI
jgi:hypothetical protein